MERLGSAVMCCILFSTATHSSLVLKRHNVTKGSVCTGRRCTSGPCPCPPGPSGPSGQLDWRSTGQSCDILTRARRDNYGRLLGRIITENRLQDLLFIDTESAISGYLGKFSSKATSSAYRWGCDDIWTQDISWSLPSLLTIIIECPHLEVATVMQQVMRVLSGGRPSVLTRPVINWVILVGAPLSAPSFLPLMSCADAVVHISPWTAVHHACPAASSHRALSVVRLWKLRDGVPATYRVNVSEPERGLVSTAGLLPSAYQGFNGHTMTVTSAPNYPPYNFVTQLPDGTEQFDGLAVDVIRSLAAQHNFKIVFKYSVDRKYGGRNKDGSWNGMVGMVMRGEADFVSAALTVTSQRSAVVDFTMAYYQKAAGILIYVSGESNNWLPFLNPLKYQVWLAYGGAALLTAVVLAIMMNLLHSSTRGRAHLIPAVLFSFAVLLQKSVKLDLQYGSVKCVAGGLWFLALVMVATYSANLTATLSTEKVSLPFTTLQGLTDQSAILPLINDGSSTLTLMKNSKSQLYQQVWEIVKDNPSALYRTQAEADDKLNSGRYARIGDFTGLQVKAAVHAQCRLFVLPDRFFPSGYGIALPKGSPFTRHFSETIRRLQQSGLDHYWFARHQPEDPCTHKLKVSASSNTMSLQQMAALFAVLVGGMLLALLVLAGEGLADKIYRTRTEKHQ